MDQSSLNELLTGVVAVRAILLKAQELQQQFYSSDWPTRVLGKKS